jgi:hypothetical protein
MMKSKREQRTGEAIAIPATPNEKFIQFEFTPELR